jgi:hypothetical protein
LEKPKRRTLTSPGLGSGLHPRQNVSTLPPVSGTRDGEVVSILARLAALGIVRLP